VRPGTRVARRLADERWEVADLAAGRAATFKLDADGLPQAVSNADRWALEA
jgi:hypothetical protein